MLVSDAEIIFPALLFYKDDSYTDAVPGPANLRYARSVQMNEFLGRELVDSAARRFRILLFVDIEERVELRRKRGWFDFWDNGKVYGFDLELEPLPPTTFRDTHNRIMTQQAALDALPRRHRGRTRSEQDKRRLEQCLSIAELIEALGLDEVGAPPAATVSVPPPELGMERPIG